MRLFEATTESFLGMFEREGTRKTNAVFFLGVQFLKNRRTLMLPFPTEGGFSETRKRVTPNQHGLEEGHQTSFPKMLSIEVVFNITVSEWDNSVNTCLDFPNMF